MIEFIAANDKYVVYQIGDVFKTIKTIDTVLFYDWLKKEDKLNWIHDWEIMGEHRQTTGVFSFDEYLNETDDRQKAKDIREYLRDTGSILVK